MSFVEKRGKPERHEVTITYLEQTAPPKLSAMGLPAQQLALMKCHQPPAGFYRHIYNAVGEPHKWVSRRYMDDAELLGLIHHDDTEIYVLHTDGWAAGFAEIDWSAIKTPAIRFFGLVPEAQGLGGVPGMVMT